MSRQHTAVLLVLASILSVQTGAVVGKSLFALAPALSVAFLRLAAAAVILVPLTRPRLRGRSGTEWLAWLGFAVPLVTMNVAIYLAFRTLPVGLAVTIEFLGPLSVALLGSRHLRDVVWVALAATGVGLLGLSPVKPNLAGVGWALLAGASWAGYIVLGERMGRTWKTADALALACAAGALVLAIPGFGGIGANLTNPRLLALGVGVGALSSVIPYSLELQALRWLPKPTFSILMSLEPGVAALVALVVLREQLTIIQVIAMACVVVASVGATRSHPPREAPVSN